MYPSNSQTGSRRRVLAAIKKANAEAFRSDRSRCAWTVTIGNVDLPAFISDGKLYVQTPLVDIFKAFAEDFSEFYGDLEVRVSNARGRTLSLDGDGRPVYGARLAESSVVRGGAEQ
jgi:hypothetical protein